MVASLATPGASRVGLLLEGLRLGIVSLWNHKLRTSLTLLGHIMGVITVITLVSLIQGLNHYVSEKILVQGSNLFYVDKIGLAFSEENFLKRMKRPDLTMANYEAVRDEAVTLSAVGAMMSTTRTLKHKKESLKNAQVIGITPDSPLLIPYDLADGRDLREEDLRHRNNVVILGHDMKQDLFGEEDPVGKTIRIGSRRHRVIGVLAPRGTVFGQSTDNFVAVPITLVMAWEKNRDTFTLLAQPENQLSTQDAEDEVQWLLRASRGLRPQEEDDFEVYSTDALMDLYRNLTSGIFLVLVGVGSVSLVVGGIVIMNIMLASVTERTREIGIRLSIGARRRDILQQFLLESLTITVFGGVIGLGIGFFLALTVSLLTGFPAQVTLEATALGLGISALVGIVFGIVPAWRAARLDPVQALRAQ